MTHVGLQCFPAVQTTRGTKLAGKNAESFPPVAHNAIPAEWEDYAMQGQSSTAT